MTMAAYSTPRLITGAGWSNPLTHNFVVEDTSHIKVYADTTLLTEGVDYTVVLNATNYEVTITTPASWSPTVWVLAVEPPLVQGTDLSGGGTFGVSYEEGLDKLLRRMQYLEGIVQSVLRLPITEDGRNYSRLPTQALRANKLLGFDSGGNPVATTGDAVSEDTLIDLVNITHAADRFIKSDGSNWLGYDLFAGANIWTATQTVRSADAGATVGPILKLDRNSASPAINDIGGQLSFTGRSSTAVERTYASINVQLVGVTNGAEIGRMNFNLRDGAGEITPLYLTNGGLRLANSYTLEVLSATSAKVQVTNSAVNVLSGSTDSVGLTTTGISINHLSGSFTMAYNYVRPTPSGLASAPEYSYQNDTNTGLRRTAADQQALVSGGKDTLIVGDSFATLLSDDAGAAVSPSLILDRNSASPAGADLLGQILFRGRDTGAGIDDYAKIRAFIIDPTPGSEDGALQFFTKIAGVETAVLVLTSGGVIDLPIGQLKFPAAQNASADANTLDDYETGTFTPGLQFGGAATGMTFGTQSGFYVKIGTLVTCYFRLQLTNKGTSTGGAVITGLPFATANLAQSATFGRVSGLANLNSMPVAYGSAVTLIIGHVNNSAGAGTGQAQLTDTNFTNSSDFYGSYTFETSA